METLAIGTAVKQITSCHLGHTSVTAPENLPPLLFKSPQEFLSRIFVSPSNLNHLQSPPDSKHPKNNYFPFMTLIPPNYFCLLNLPGILESYLQTQQEGNGCQSSSFPSYFYRLSHVRGRTRAADPCIRTVS